MSNNDTPKPPSPNPTGTIQNSPTPNSTGSIQASPVPKQTGAIIRGIQEKPVKK